MLPLTINKDTRDRQTIVPQQSNSTREKFDICVISGFSCKAAENCIILCYYAASGGNLLPKCCDKLLVPFSRVDGTDSLSRNFGKNLPILAAS
jgi:hypothetical protein